MEIHLNGMMPKEYAEEFLQMIRTFDQTHPDCHFELETNDDTITLEQARSILDRINPKFPVEYTWKKLGES